MPTDPPPIACSLTAGELKRRVAAITALGAESLLGPSSEGGESTLRFRDGPGTRQRLQAILAAERECCPFLGLELRAEGEELTLTITAPPDGQPAAKALADAFTAASPP